jgi:hypothetical protein
MTDVQCGEWGVVDMPDAPLSGLKSRHCHMLPLNHYSFCSLLAPPYTSTTQHMCYGPLFKRIWQHHFHSCGYPREGQAGNTGVVRHIYVYTI